MHRTAHKAPVLCPRLSRCSSGWSSANCSAEPIPSSSRTIGAASRVVKSTKVSTIELHKTPHVFASWTLLGPRNSYALNEDAIASAMPVSTSSCVLFTPGSSTWTRVAMATAMPAACRPAACCQLTHSTADELRRVETATPNIPASISEVATGGRPITAQPIATHAPATASAGAPRGSRQISKSSRVMRRGSSGWSRGARACISGYWLPIMPRYSTSSTPALASPGVMPCAWYTAACAASHAIVIASSRVSSAGSFAITMSTALPDAVHVAAWRASR